MKHILYFQGQTYYHDSELQRCEFVLLGQRDAEPSRPPVFRRSAMTADQKEEAMAFARDSTNGKFAVKPLTWCATVEEAEAAKASFPEWLNLQVVPVSTVIENG